VSASGRSKHATHYDPARADPPAVCLAATKRQPLNVCGGRAPLRGTYTPPKAGREMFEVVFEILLGRGCPIMRGAPTLGEVAVRFDGRAKRPNPLVTGGLAW
jgi:hypothetical protein